jgi:heterotetrameric sarcosine oxidase gamma subunit
MAVPPGRTVYTGLLNRRGTYESDLTVTRISPSEFLLVSSAATTERDQDHIRRHIRPTQQATLVDITSSYAVYGVMGPRSRDLLTRLTRSNLSNDAFPFGTSRTIDLGYSTVRATRITYVGELGWELYVPTEFAVGAYEDLFAAGEDLSVRNGGYYAIESMRLEKGYRAYGRELTPDYNPVEAGLQFACKLRTDIPFLGRDALEKARANGPRRRLVSLALAEPEPMLWGGELVLREGIPAGQIISAAWGATLGSCVGLAYLWGIHEEVIDRAWVESGSYTVDIGGLHTPAEVSMRALFDPAGDRTKG